MTIVAILAPFVALVTVAAVGVSTHALLKLPAVLSSVGLAAGVLAQAATSEIAPSWLEATAPAMAVAALVEIARRFASGAIVARNVAEAEEHLKDALERAHNRESEYAALVRYYRRDQQ